jgi:hypothetical protein
LQKAFTSLAQRKTLVVLEELAEHDRIHFDEVYLQTAGISTHDASDTRNTIARELREIMAERRTRPDSVADLKAQRAPKQRANRQIDAFAARIVSKILPYPDPRQYFEPEHESVLIQVGDFSLPLTLGEGLFDSGTVFSGTDVVATTQNSEQARFVRAVLTLDPDERELEVPSHENLTKLLKCWSKAVDVWWNQFTTTEKMVVSQIVDLKIIAMVRQRALEISHASETPENRIVSHGKRSSRR